MVCRNYRRSAKKSSFRKFLLQSSAAHGIMSAATEQGAFLYGHHEFFSDEMVEQMVDGASSEGKFKAKSGRIFLSDGLDYEVDPNVYGIYKVDGSTLTILDYVGEDENFLGMYPLTFTKAG